MKTKDLEKEPLDMEIVKLFKRNINPRNTKTDTESNDNCTNTKIWVILHENWILFFVVQFITKQEF